MFGKKFKNEDYYINQDGYRIFTEKYHLKRGYCCKSGCKHCPYGYDKKTDTFRQISKINIKLIDLQNVKSFKISIFMYISRKDVSFKPIKKL